MRPMTLQTTAAVGVALTIIAAAARTDEAKSGAKPDSEKRPAGAEKVEVRFVNGSIVVMTLLQPNFEISTDYGILVVPCRDIRQIEFGVHTSEEERRTIDDAVFRLAAENAVEREAAIRDLTAIGPQAYKRLRGVAADDTDASKGAQAAMSQIRAKFHPRMLRQQEDDVVRTPKFTIVGRIVTPTIKASSEEFGESVLQTMRLLSMQALSPDSAKVIVIDAAQAGRSWIDTGVDVNANVTLTIRATGMIDLQAQQPGQMMVGPDGGGPGGVAFADRVAFEKRAPVAMNVTSGGQLMGRVGDGPAFVVGSRYSQFPVIDGRLYLRIAPSPFGNNLSGEYRVSISTGGASIDAEP